MIMIVFILETIGTIFALLIIFNILLADDVDLTIEIDKEVIVDYHRHPDDDEESSDK